MIVRLNFTLEVNGFSKEFTLEFERDGSYSNQNILENTAHFIEHSEDLADILSYS